jgi:hypothetical protein
MGRLVLVSEGDKPGRTEIVSLKIRYDSTTDWGCCGSDDDRDNYEAAVADAISAAFPGADVTVQSVHAARSRVIVTTRDEDGRILTDRATFEREAEIEESVLLIAADIWDQGDFWSVAS